MNNRIVYKTALESDIPLFIAYFRKSIPLLFTKYSPLSIRYTLEVDYGPEWMAGRLKKGAKRAYLALSQGEIVGYLFTERPNAGVSFADWLAVDKSFQKRGIASKLLSMWERDALKDGAHSLHLWTTKNNLRFYKNRGFAKGGLFPKAWHGIDTYLIYRTLRMPEEKNFLKSYLQSLKKKDSV